MKSILGHLLLFRIANVFLVKTSFVPDEYWQALEVAHKSAFGYGYLTWEWSHGLRSYLYPSIFTIVYRSMKIFHMDFSELLIYTPRVIQAILSGFSDWYFYHFVKNNFGASVARVSLLSLLSSWFWWFCATRTLVNTLEASALCIGLYYYPWSIQRGKGDMIYFQFIAVIITVLRPTAAVVWIPLALWHIVRKRSLRTVSSYIILSVVILSCTLLLDYVFYRRFVFVLWNFFTFNFVNNLGVHYGSHPWHWYLSQGIPVVIGIHLVLAIYGVGKVSEFPCHQRNICKCLIILFSLTCVAYSFVGHKEFRFILHLIPISSLFCGIAISKLSRIKQNHAITLLLITNVPVALYIGLIHQGAPLRIMGHLGDQFRISCKPDCPGQVLFLMPCHTTPLYSHMHVNVSVRFVECPPNLHDTPDYRDESDLFYEDPELWLTEHIFHESAIKSDQYHWILMFDSLYRELNDYQPLQRYKICGKAFYSHIPESRRGAFIYLLCRH